MAAIAGSGWNLNGVKICVVGFYFYSELGAWSTTQFVSIVGCYLAIVSLVITYFSLEEESEGGN